MRKRLWAILLIVAIGLGGLPGCGDTVVGSDCGGIMASMAVFLVEVRYVTDYTYAGVGFTVTASQNNQEVTNGITDGNGYAMMYVMQAGPTKICASKSGFLKQCKTVDAVLGNVMLVHFVWQQQSLQDFTGLPAD